MKNGGIDPNPKSDSNSMDWLLFHSDHIVISIKKGEKESLEFAEALQVF